MESNLESTQSSKNVPRPPNAWIIFRAQMSHILSAQYPESTQSQANLSKVISKMWKTIDPAAKAEFERLAEVAKVKHEIENPGYRYMPKSKEEKERERKEKRRMKAEGRLTERVKRSKRRVSPNTAVDHGMYALGTLPFPITTTHQPLSRFGPCGPSPPISAANSPSPSETWIRELPDMLCGNQACGERPSNSSLVIPTVNQEVPCENCFENGDSLHRLQEVHSRLQNVLSYEDQSTRDRYQFDPPYMVARRQHQLQKRIPYQLPPLNSYTNMHEMGYLPVQHEDRSSTSSTLCESNATTPNSADDSFSFGLPPLAMDNTEAWVTENPEFQSFYTHASIDGNSFNPYQFQFEPFDQPNVTESARTLEVEAGNMFSLTDILGKEAFEWPSDSKGCDDVPQQTTSLPPEQNCASLQIPSLTSSSYYSNVDTCPDALFDKFINLDALCDNPALAESSLPGPYIPPSGAARSSDRRVAASWDRSFAIPDIGDIQA